MAPWVLAATILGSSMTFIDETAITVALPAIQEALVATAVDAQWVVEAYTLLLAALDLPPEVKQQLEQEKIKLGAAEVTEGVDAALGATVERAVDEAFVSAYRAVMLVAAAIALASGMSAALLIEGKKPKVGTDSGIQ